MRRPPDEVTRTVVEDLRFLRDEWDEEVTDASLRRSSTVLGRLLVEGDLQKAWLNLGFEKEPRIPTATLAHVLKHVPLETLAFASAGGGRYQGMELRGTMMVGRVMPVEEMDSILAKGLPEEVLGLHAFKEGLCMVVEGVGVRRRHLIKYVALKLGGAHHDPKRGLGAEDAVFAKLDKVRSRLEVGGKNAIYFELLSVGQMLARADDISELLKRAEPDVVPVSGA